MSIRMGAYKVDSTTIGYGEKELKPSKSLLIGMQHRTAFFKQKVCHSYTYLVALGYGDKELKHSKSPHSN